MTVNRRMNELIQSIKDAGFRVFTRKGGDTYAFFTDGTNFGYVQRERGMGGYSISSVHKPNKTTGTGFGLGEFDELTKENLSKAFCLAPEWAYHRDRETVKKYESVESFLKAHSWGSGLTEVE